ncbi:hypothetical protein CEXT_470031 [Caerostris extrusa]|uniref:Uncharacterized protein n=1 Tax=Caerostris extrusa TaxID=172846 RepID=A0AAV4NTK3_CAEEX|nr:hypothetical protein CEXT_470031 [Caerostris extrusa]
MATLVDNPLTSEPRKSTATLTTENKGHESSFERVKQYYSHHNSSRTAEKPTETAGVQKRIDSELSAPLTPPYKNITEHQKRAGADNKEQLDTAKWTLEKSEARSAEARYFCLWNRFSSSQICMRVKLVLGFFLLGGVRFWYGCPIRLGGTGGSPAPRGKGTVQKWKKS